MANYRKRYSKMTGKWTPVAAVSKTLSTRKIAERIEKESTVSIADIMAVLYSLPHVLRDEMANGNAVKLDGVGSFALTVQCHKTGVDRAEDVDPYSQITNVKVQFRPEKASVQVAGMKKMQTSLVANDITWRRAPRTPAAPPPRAATTRRPRHRTRRRGPTRGDGPLTTGN